MPWSATLPLSRWGAVELPQAELREVPCKLYPISASGGDEMVCAFWVGGRSSSSGVAGPA